jgi:Flp pilus assembly protein TadG
MKFKKPEDRLGGRRARVRRRGGLRRDEHGGTLIEMAIVLPTFFLMLFGYFNFAVILFEYCTANYASLVAVRYAALHSNTSLNPATTTSIQAVVAQYLILPSSVTPHYTITYSGGNVVGQSVGVTVYWTAPSGMAVKNYTVTGHSLRLITR